MKHSVMNSVDDNSLLNHIKACFNTYGSVCDNGKIGSVHGGAEVSIINSIDNSTYGSVCDNGEIGSVHGGAEVCVGCA